VFERCDENIESIRSESSKIMNHDDVQ